MEWRKFQYLNRMICETPLGDAIMMWSHEEETNYYVSIDNVTIICESIGDAKEKTLEYLKDKSQELMRFVALEYLTKDVIESIPS